MLQRISRTLLLSLSVVTAGAATEGRTWLSSVDEAVAEARTRDRLILVDLYADWCGWCKKLEKEVFTSSAFQDYARDFVLLRVDTEDGGEGTRLQERYGAYALPTTLVLDSRQVKIGEILGFAPAGGYIDRIESEIAVWRELENGYRDFRQSTDRRVLAILADEFHKRLDGERAGELYRRILSTGELSESEEARTRYQLADALRIAGRYDRALEEVNGARAGASRADEPSLLERLDLLAAEIALDRGDCQRARTALRDFLNRHPQSQLRRHAKRSLAALEAEGSRCT